MSLEVLYLLRKDDPGLSIRELDDVVLTAEALTMDGDVIPAGTKGTVVAVMCEGQTFAVEFAEPAGALASVSASDLRRAGRQAP